MVERVVYYDAILYEGLTVGETKDPNVGSLLEMHEGIELYNENFDGFVEEIPKLQQGEVYLPPGSKGKLSCDITTLVSDTVKAVKYSESIHSKMQTASVNGQINEEIVAELGEVLDKFTL